MIAHALFQQPARVLNRSDLDRPLGDFPAATALAACNSRTASAIGSWTRCVAAWSTSEDSASARLRDRPCTCCLTVTPRCAPPLAYQPAAPRPHSPAPARSPLPPLTNQLSGQRNPQHRVGKLQAGNRRLPRQADQQQQQQQAEDQAQAVEQQEQAAVAEADEQSVASGEIDREATLRLALASDNGGLDPHRSGSQGNGINSRGVFNSSTAADPETGNPVGILLQWRPARNLHFPSPPAPRGEMPQAEGGSGRALTR